MVRRTCNPAATAIVWIRVFVCTVEAFGIGVTYYFVLRAVVARSEIAGTVGLCAIVPADTAVFFVEPGVDAIAVAYHRWIWATRCRGGSAADSLGRRGGK